VAVTALVFVAGACTDDRPPVDRPGGDPVDQATTPTPIAGLDAAAVAPVARRMLPVNGTTLSIERRGRGQPLLLVHGGGEDASMLAAQAEDLAAVGFEVVTYDRRGTGRSGREDWPGGGAGQHADDAAALLEALGLGPATVVGVSSGGVVALALAARHPERVARVVAWEPPAAGVVPGGTEVTAQLMAPIEAHLAAHPGDVVGAQALLLSFIVGVPVAVDDPAFAATRANAEPMVRDEPQVTLEPLSAAGLAGRDVTVAVGSAPNEVIAAAVEVLAGWTGRPPVQVAADHEVYLVDPSVLTGIVTQR
jgi:pimeloyl-ACP methyl ester carboxylesterase